MMMLTCVVWHSFQDPRCDVHHHHHHHHLHSYKDEPACCESAASTYPLTASAHLGGASSSVLSGNTIQFIHLSFHVANAS